MVIYKTVNLINNKVYIGKDKNNNPNYYGSGKIFIQALKKYGKENFKKEILEYCKSEDELCDREIYWIKYYKNLLGKQCYNIVELSSGGNNFQFLSEERKIEVRKKISLKVRSSNRIPHKDTLEERKIKSERLKKRHELETLTEKSNRKQKARETKLKNGTHPSQDYMRDGNRIKGFVRKHSEETKKKLRERCSTPKSEEHKKKISESHKGKALSKEHKEKISNALKGRVSPNKGKVMSLEVKRKISARTKGRKLTGERLDRLTSMNKARTGFKHSKETKDTISKKNKGRIRSSEEREKRKISRLKRKFNKIIQLSLAGEIIKVYHSLEKLRSEKKFSLSSIRRVCRGQQLEHQGFDWVQENTKKYNNYEIKKEDIYTL